MFGRKRQARRNNALPQHPSPDRDGVRRVMPMEMWEGEIGEKLRQLGFSPDDEHNVIADNSEFERRFEQRESALGQHVERLNAKLPDGTTVTPFAMIPWAVWQQQHAQAAEFLLGRLNLYPVDPWNTLLLPSDQHSSLVLDLPRHPRCYPDGYEDACARIVLEIRAEHSQQATPIVEKGTSASMDDISRHGEIHETTIRKIAGLAAALSSQILGEKAFFRSKELFG